MSYVLKICSLLTSWPKIYKLTCLNYEKPIDELELTDLWGSGKVNQYASEGECSSFYLSTSQLEVLYFPAKEFGAAWRTPKLSPQLALGGHPYCHSKRDGTKSNHAETTGSGMRFFGQELIYSPRSNKKFGEKDSVTNCQPTILQIFGEWY